MAGVAAFGWTVRTRFQRINPPWEGSWAECGQNQMYYRVDGATAGVWKAIRAESPLAEDPEA